MSTRRIVWTDEDYDTAHGSTRASDGGSRFGAYLRQRRDQFGDDGEPLAPVWFASLVWRIASSPVMSPPYVKTSSRVHEVVCQGDEYAPGVLQVDVHVPLLHPSQVWDVRAAGWRDWTHHRDAWRDDDPLPLVEPDQYPRLLFSTTFAIAIPAGSLPAPTSTGVDVDLAKQAVETVCSWVNRKVGPELESLLIRWQQRPVRGGGVR